MKLDDATRTKITNLHAIYRLEMKQGTELQAIAWKHHKEAELASDDYVAMRAEFRSRAGNDGHGDATNDYKYSQYKEPQTAGKDNAWYMTRAQTAAQLATMHFAKAAAVQAEILRLQTMQPYGADSLIGD